MIASSVNVMPSGPPVGRAPAAAGFPPSPASRSVPAAPTKGGPPRRSDAKGPGLKASSTVAAIRNGAAAPTAPVTGGGAGSGKSRASARPAASAGRRRAAPFAIRAARQGAHSTAGDTLRARPPAAACAAPSPRWAACRAAAGASHWRRSASRLSERPPSARDATPGDAPKASVWIARRLPVMRRAVRAAHIGPTPGRPSVIWWRYGRRRSP